MIFKPIKNRVIAMEFIGYFVVLCSLPVVFYMATGNVNYIETLKQFFVVHALIAYAIAHKRAKSVMSDIELGEEAIIGPGPFTLFPFRKTRVQLSYAQLCATMDASAIASLLAKPVIKLADKNGHHIALVKALYEPQLFEQLKQKLGVQSFA